MRVIRPTEYNSTFLRHFIDVWFDEDLKEGTIISPENHPEIKLVVDRKLLREQGEYKYKIRPENLGGFISAELLEAGMKWNIRSVPQTRVVDATDLYTQGGALIRGTARAQQNLASLPEHGMLTPIGNIKFQNNSDGVVLEDEEDTIPLEGYTLIDKTTGLYIEYEHGVNMIEYYEDDRRLKLNFL